MLFLAGRGGSTGSSSNMKSEFKRAHSQAAVAETADTGEMAKKSALYRSCALSQISEQHWREAGNSVKAKV